MSDIPKCGFFGIFTSFLRRVMCVGTRRGSNDSCYRELDDQDARYDNVESSDTTPSSDPSEEVADTKEIEEAMIFQKRPLGSFQSLKREPRQGALSSSLLDEFYTLSVRLLLAKCTNWEFDTHELDRATGGRCLPVLCMHLFSRYGLLSFFKLLPEKCLKLFCTIDDNYHAKNRYHNSVHAADVTQAVHCFLQEPRLRKFVSPMEILVVLLAAITHDLDHPGVNHAFLVATHHPLAIMFKDKDLGLNDRTPVQRRKNRLGPCQSILEHHHWRMAYSCILESGVFDHMSDRLPEIKRKLKSLILATDITQQDLYLNVFLEHLQRKTLNMNRAEHRHIVLQMALKTADISNPGRPWSISYNWSQQVCAEFFAQGDQETLLNFKVSNLCDRNKDTIPNIQKGFYAHVVMPLFKAWHLYLESKLSKKMIQNVLRNATEWANRTQCSDSEITDEDMVERKLETSTIISGSSEMLIVPSLSSDGASAITRVSRRRSYSPMQQSTLKDAIRRYSAPLHIFNENTKPRIRPKSSISEYILREDLKGVPANALLFAKPKRCISMSDIVLAITKCQSRRASTQAPLAVPTQDLVDISTPKRFQGVEYKLEIDSDDDDESSDEKVVKKVGSIIIEESTTSSGTPTLTSSAGLNGSSNNFLQASLSAHTTSSAPSSDSRLDRLDEGIPAAKTAASSCDMITFTPAKNAMNEITDVLLPQLSFSNLYNRRRGSAPAPVAVSDLQRLASDLTLQLERRKQSVSSCHQRVAVEEVPAGGFARRGSLPVEVMTGASIST